MEIDATAELAISMNAGAQASDPDHRARASDLGAAVVGEWTGAHRGRRGRGLFDDDGDRGAVAGLVVGVAAY
jgi:hypothetical protein